MKIYKDRTRMQQIDLIIRNINSLSTLLIVCVILFYLTGCTQHEHDIPADDPAIVLRVVAPSLSAGSRAEGTPVAHEEGLVFKSGWLVFSGTTGEIVFITPVVTGMSAGNNIGINDLTSTEGATLEGVPRDASTVDFFGNLPTDVTTPAIGDDIAVFRATVIGIATQTDNTGFVNNVSIYGTGAIDRTGRPYQAGFTASSILSRVEVGQLKADGVNIVSFDLAGIFINYFYPEASLTGNTGQSAFIEYTSTDLFEENGEVYYSTSFKTVLYDYQPANPWLGKLNGYNYTPHTTGNVWAYNLFSGNVPHIIFRLKNVTASSALITANGGIDPYILRENWYITVTGFKESGVQLTEIKQGEVYHFSTIPVTPETLDPLPEPGDGILAEVKVKVMDWTDKIQSGELPHYPW